MKIEERIKKLIKFYERSGRALMSNFPKSMMVLEAKDMMPRRKFIMLLIAA